MSDLAPYPLGALAQRILREFDTRQSIFDLPKRKFVLGDSRHDLSVRFHGHTAATAATATSSVWRTAGSTCSSRVSL